MIRAVIPAILAGTLFCSCDELLDRMPYDGLIKAEFWQSEEDVNAALMGCYDQMQECLYNFVIWGEARGDMLIVDRGYEAKELNEQIVSQYNGACNWKPFYVLINRVNTVIENAPAAQENDADFTPEELDAITAECYFLRAFAYFYLVRTFKEAPLITASYATDDQEYYFPKSPSAEIYAQIIEDLDYAEQFASTSYGNVIEDHGRATRYAINTLKADVYLWMGMEDPTHYEKCVEEADKVIQSGTYVLENGADWFNLYYPGNSSESIFELQYNAGLLEFNSLVDWFSIEGETPMYSVRLDKETSKVVFWTENLAAEDAVRGRNRSYATISSDNIVWKYSGSGTLPTRRRSADFSDGNWIIYRLAELHLIKAEALNRLGNIEASISEVNIVRQRAQLPPLDVSISSENLAFEILEERKRELAFEGKRWYDLVRYSFNYGPEYLVNRIYKAWEDIEISQRITNEESWFLPIYYEELRINKSLEQNPYYDF
ncbi:MAG: RagB/SusD family nutrient uptake outer membrane protein [Bacteroidales bacterium]